MRSAAGAYLPVLAAAAFAAWRVLSPTDEASAQQPDSGAGQPTATRDKREAMRARRASKGNLVGHGGPIKALAYDARSRRVLSGSFDYSMMLWDVGGDDPRVLARLEDHGGAVNAVAFVPGTDTALAAGDDGKVALWDLAKGVLLHRFEGHEAKIVALAVSPDGRFAVSASWDRTARLWDLAARTAGPVLQGHTGPVNAAVFSSDGRKVFTASADGSIGVWSARDGGFERPLYQHGWGINVLAPLPDGSLAFGSLNGAAGILDPETGARKVELPAHERPILALSVIDKPGLLALGSGDGRVEVVRLPDGQVLEEHRTLFGPVWALALSGDGTQAYYAGLDDFATLWRIAPREPFEAPTADGPRRFQVRPEARDLVSAGEAQFARKCSICHSLDRDGRNRAGPTLFGVFGRRIATLPGYPFSPALKELDIVWNEATIDKLFALGPDEFTPGSKMPLQRMSDPEQRAALIAYLKLATSPDQPVDGQERSGHDSSTRSEPER